MISKYSVGKKLFTLVLLLLSTTVFANIGTIMALKGEAQVVRSSGDIDVMAGMELLEGDSIITQSKSRVQVMLKDETVVTIGSKSEFSFDEYSFDGADSKVTMKASRGFFRSVTGKIGKLAPERFKVKTASATIGIRGTDFWGITGGEIEKVTCNQGTIVIEYDGKIIEVSAGNYVSYGQGGVTEGKINSDEEGKETNSNLEVVEDFTEVTIPTEDIADVTQIIENTGLIEPFTINLGGQDRPVQY